MAVLAVYCVRGRMDQLCSQSCVCWCMYVHNRDVCNSNLCSQTRVACQIFMSERLGPVYVVIVFYCGGSDQSGQFQVDLLLKTENSWLTCYQSANGKHYRSRMSTMSACPFVSTSPTEQQTSLSVVTWKTVLKMWSLSECTETKRS